MYNVLMSGINFEWDERKNEENKKKHKLYFKEARTVFFDENAVRFEDPDHSIDEQRFIMLGVSFKLRILVVVHCLIEKNIIRIISARKATKNEQAIYER